MDIFPRPIVYQSDKNVPLLSMQTCAGDHARGGGKAQMTDDSSNIMEKQMSV